MSTSPLRKRNYKENLGVFLVALSTAAILYLNYDPIPAGSRPSEADWASAGVPSFLQQEISVEPERSAGPGESEPLSGRSALLMQTRLLEQGLQQLVSVSDYSATFVKQEKLEGVLTEPHVIKVKIRQEPFSVYLKWLKGGDVGKEVAYVDGENDDRMLVRFGGLKGRMLPTLKISPTGDLAMSKARYPITELGLAKLIERILEFRYRDLELSAGVNCCMIEAERIKQHDCHCFVVNYDDPEISPKFRKSYIYINRDNCLPVCVKNFGWPLDGAEVPAGKKLDEETLLECYSYTDLCMEDQLSAGVFELADTSP